MENGKWKANTGLNRVNHFAFLCSTRHVVVFLVWKIGGSGVDMILHCAICVHLLCQISTFSTFMRHCQAFHYHAYSESI